MRTASLFKNGKNQAVRLPKEFEFDSVTEVEITRDGESLVLTPKRKSWTSFVEIEKADTDFLADRQDVMEEGRCNCEADLYARHQYLFFHYERAS